MMFARRRRCHQCGLSSSSIHTKMLLQALTASSTVLLLSSSCDFCCSAFTMPVTTFLSHRTIRPAITRPSSKREKIPRGNSRKSRFRINNDLNNKRSSYYFLLRLPLAPDSTDGNVQHDSSDSGSAENITKSSNNNMNEENQDPSDSSPNDGKVVDMLNDANCSTTNQTYTINDDEDYGDGSSFSSSSSEDGVDLQEWLVSTGGSIPLGVLLERAMDTIEDIIVHLRRLPREREQQSLSPEEVTGRKTIVVLGSGWGAHALLKVADCGKLRIIVVSPSNHFLFTPMLASSAVGTVEYRSMTEAVRSANPMIEEYLEGKAISVNINKKTIQVQLNTLVVEQDRGNQKKKEPPTMELQYDHVVVSVGCQVNDRGVPGAAKKALQLKTCEDAMTLRKRIGECFEYASRPDVVNNPNEQRRRATILIVGGGPTGVELAGELLDLAKDITRPHPKPGPYPKLQDLIQVTLVHSGPDLVPQFNPELREEALLSLQRKGAQVMLNTRVIRVGDDFVQLQSKSKAKSYELPVGLTVWCAGTKPNPFVEELLKQLPPEARNPEDGRVEVDSWLRPPMPKEELLGSVLVLGDAAAFTTAGVESANEQREQPQNCYLPQTAQVAGQQGAFCARMLDRGYDLTTTPPMLSKAAAEEDEEEAALTSHKHGEVMTTNNTNIFDDPAMAQWLALRGLEKAPPFVFLNLGLLAYLGGGEALSQVQLGDDVKLSYFGSVAYVLWRSVYLVKQVATRNRVLVTFDWIKSALFGRDMTRF